jgi:RHS repeat-associated protein
MMILETLPGRNTKTASLITACPIRWATYKTKEQTDRQYGAGGRLLQSGATKYSYDEEGNLVRKTSAQGNDWIYEWAGNGMLKKVTRPDGKEVGFEYDALGRRTAKIYHGTITRWVWDGNTPLHEWKYGLKERPKVIVDEFGDVSKDREEPVDDLISWLFDEGTFKPAGKLKGGAVQSIITDYLGTPVEMYDSAGKQTWGVEYDVYGKIRKSSVGGAVDCPFRYQGQYEDEETGLYYNRFRYYDAHQGIYISTDPISIQGGLNVNAYVHDPNIFVDVFGLAIAPPGTVLYHYTNEDGMNSIISSNSLNPSLKEVNPRDARYGNGQYLSNLAPGTKTPAQLGREFIGIPNKHRFTHYVAIDVSGLDVVEGRKGVLVIPGEKPLNLTDRIVGSGKVCK